MKDFATNKILKTFIEISFLLAYTISSNNAYTLNFKDEIYSYSLYETKQSYTIINCFRKFRFLNKNCPQYHNPLLVEDKKSLQKNSSLIKSFSKLARSGINNNVVLIQGRIINNSTNVKDAILKNTSLIKNTLYSP